MSVSVNSTNSIPEIPLRESARTSLQTFWDERQKRLLVIILLLLTFTIGLLASIGWLAGNELLHSIVPGYASMQISTATSFILLSLAGGGYLYAGRYSRSFSVACAACVVVIAFLTILESSQFSQFSLSRYLFSTAIFPSDNPPAPMALATVAGFLFASVAVIALLYGNMKIAQLFSLLVTTLGLLLLLAYLFDRSAIYGFAPFATVALNTTAGFFFLGLAILLLVPDKAYFSFLFLESAGGLVARRYAPFVLLVPFFMAGFVMMGEIAVGFSAHFGLFLLSVVIAASLMYALSKICLYVHDLEQRNHQTEVQQQLSAERLAQIHRIESMGLVAGGIAHDFKNLLMPIAWSADIGLANLEKHDVNYKRYRTILNSANRAADLAERMMALGKQKPLEFEFLDLNCVLVDFEDILLGVSKGRVEIELRLGEPLAEIIADRVHLEQILVNLTSNACQAMGNSGSIVIETSQCCIVAEQMQALSSAKVETGDYVCLSVADTGKGMTEGEKKRALEPFYSTKSTGEGHGLGLSNVHDMVLQHLGFLDINSSPGKGTVVHIYFPASMRTKAQIKIQRTGRPEEVNGGTPLSENAVLATEDGNLRHTL